MDIQKVNNLGIIDTMLNICIVSVLGIVLSRVYSRVAKGNGWNGDQYWRHRLHAWDYRDGGLANSCHDHHVRSSSMKISFRKDVGKRRTVAKQ